MQALDWVVIVAYLAGITAIGLWSARRVKSPDDFFMGGRRFKKAFMLFFAFGAGTHTDQAVSVASKTYTSGLSGIWLQWIWLFATPFYWLVAPVFRRMRALTTGDYFELRYTRSVAGLFAGVAVLQLVVNLATMLKGAGAMITAVSGGAIAEVPAIATIVVLFSLYGVAGGLSAAIITDFVQGILTVVLSFLILPFALDAVGGMAGLRLAIDDPAMFALVAGADVTVFYIAVVAFNGLIGNSTQPHSMAVAAAGETEMDGRVGFTYGNMLKRFCTVAWTFTGLAAIALYPGMTGQAQIDQAYGLMARDLLPLVGPGLLGLFLASMLAAVMSSCDAWMVSGSALFTENIYRAFVAPQRSGTHYLWVGRVFSLVLVASCVAYAVFLDSVITGLETFWKVQAMMGIPFWVGIFWRRATPAGAWASTLCAFFVAILVGNGFAPLVDVNALGVAYLPAGMMLDGALRLPVQMLAYLSCGLLAMVAVSLWTEPVDPARLDRMYRALQTPVDGPEPTPAKAFDVPEGSVPRPGRKIIDHPDFEIRYPSRVGGIGFAVAWAWVAALIGGVFWLATL
jgi:Na+/proline symporter